MRKKKESERGKNQFATISKIYENLLSKYLVNPILIVSAGKIFYLGAC